jgi:hypothetical protein
MMDNPGLRSCRAIVEAYEMNGSKIDIVQREPMQHCGRGACERDPTTLGCKGSTREQQVAAEGVAGLDNVGRGIDPAAQPDDRAITHGDVKAAVRLTTVKRLRSAEDSAAGLNDMPEVLHAPTVKPSRCSRNLELLACGKPRAVSSELWIAISCT